VLVRNVRVLEIEPHDPEGLYRLFRQFPSDFPLDNSHCLCSILESRYF
jgi:hypothetical protein